MSHRSTAPFAAVEQDGPRRQLLGATLATGDTFDVQQLDVHEAMSSLFRVEVVALAHNSSVDIEAAVGRPATVTLQSASGERSWSGLCQQLSQLRAESDGMSTYRFTVVPSLWQATKRRNHRMFQQMSDRDIALALLSEWDVAPMLQLGDTCTKRKYRVQYGESDYAFICRLLEEAGISFFFETGSVMVLSEQPQSAPSVGSIPFHDQPTWADHTALVTKLELGRQMRAGRYAARDAGDQPHSATHYSFETNMYQLSPGVVMQVTGHPHAGVGAGLLVTETHLVAKANERWVQRSVAVSAAEAYQPEMVTPKPHVMGMESATVVGPPGEEIRTDELGRIRVHFHWDGESRMNDNSSCWIPVSQPWGGAGYEPINLPRAGQEVIVGFLGGDPDRPVIMGRVHTGLQQVPHKLHFAHDQQIGVGQSRVVSVGDSERVSIGLNHSMMVGNNKVARVGGDHSVTIAGSSSHNVARSYSLEVGLQKHIMAGKRIVLETKGGAKIILNDNNIILQAENISLDAENINLDAENIILDAENINLDADKADGKN